MSDTEQEKEARTKPKEWQPDPAQVHELKVHLLTGMENALEHAIDGQEGRELIRCGMPGTPQDDLRVLAEAKRLPDDRTLSITLSFGAPVYLHPGPDSEEPRESRAMRVQVMRALDAAFEHALPALHDDNLKGALQEAGLREKAYSPELPSGNQYSLTSYGGSVKLEPDDPAYNRHELPNITVLGDRRSERPAGVTEMDVNGNIIYLSADRAKKVLESVRASLNRLQVPAVNPANNLQAVATMEQPPAQLGRTEG